MRPRVVRPRVVRPRVTRSDDSKPFPAGSSSSSIWSQKCIVISTPSFDSTIVMVVLTYANMVALQPWWATQKGLEFQCVISPRPPTQQRYTVQLTKPHTKTDLEEIILFHHTVMEHCSNVPREEVVHSQDYNGQSTCSNSGEKVEVPTPTKVGIQANQFAMFIGKWEENRRII